MPIRNISIQGRFQVPATDTIYRVALTRDRTKDSADLAAPDANNNTWYVFHPSASKIVSLSIKNISGSATILVSWTNGEKWMELEDRDSWEGIINGYIFMVTVAGGGTVPAKFQFTADVL